MELFLKTVYAFRQLITFAKGSILDVGLDSEYVSADGDPMINFLKKRSS